MDAILLMLVAGVGLVAVLALVVAPLARRATTLDQEFHLAATTHRRARRLARLAQAGRQYHRHGHA